MAKGITWMLLALFKEGPRLKRAERRDDSWQVLMRQLGEGWTVELSTEEYGQLRAGYRGRQNVQQLILCFFSWHAADRSLVFVWREQESGEHFAKRLTDNEKQMAIQTFGLKVEFAPPPPRVHRGVCQLEHVWADEWFVLPNGTDGWVTARQENPLGDTIDVVLGFYYEFPTLPRGLLVYIVDEKTEHRVLQQRWAPRRLVTLENPPRLQARPGQVQPAKTPVVTIGLLEELRQGEVLALPAHLDDEETLRERLFIEGHSVEIPRALYQRLTQQSQRIYRDRDTVVCQDEFGRAHLFWKCSHRYYTRQLTRREAEGIDGLARLSA